MLSSTMNAVGKIARVWPWGVMPLQPPHTTWVSGDNEDLCVGPQFHLCVSPSQNRAPWHVGRWWVGMGRSMRSAPPEVHHQAACACEVAAFSSLRRGTDEDLPRCNGAATSRWLQCGLN